jgi:hypothetical protein
LNVLRDQQMARASFSSAARNAQAGGAPAAPAPVAAPRPRRPATAGPRMVDPTTVDESGNDVRQMTSRDGAQAKWSSTSARSVAEQIEQVLRTSSGQPAFRGRSIHVWQSPGGGGLRWMVHFQGGRGGRSAVRRRSDVVREWESRRAEFTPVCGGTPRGQPPSKRTMPPNARANSFARAPG